MPLLPGDSPANTRAMILPWVSQGAASAPLRYPGRPGSHLGCQRGLRLLLLPQGWSWLRAGVWAWGGAHSLLGVHRLLPSPHKPSCPLTAKELGI